MPATNVIAICGVVVFLGYELVLRGGETQAATSWPLPTSRTSVDSTLTVVLPDGRVAGVMMTDATHGVLLVFVEQNGHWLIDERYQIVPAYSADQKG